MARPSYGRTLHPSTTDDGDNHPHWELFVACHICGVTKIIHVPDGCTDIDSEAVMIMMMLVMMMTLRMTMMLMTVM